MIAYVATGLLSLMAGLYVVAMDPFGTDVGDPGDANGLVFLQNLFILIGAAIVYGLVCRTVEWRLRKRERPGETWLSRASRNSTTWFRVVLEVGPPSVPLSGVGVSRHLRRQCDVSLAGLLRAEAWPP